MDRKEFIKGLGKLIGKVVKETNEIVEDIKGEVGKTMKPLDDMGAEMMQMPEVIEDKPINKKLKLPPGAIEGKKAFKETCTGCGDCIHHCPYNAIFPVFENRYGKSIPYMDLNHNPCLMCKDWPCITSCKPKALKPFKKKETPKFGQAVSLFSFCLNSENPEASCDICLQSCPLEDIIKFKDGKPSFSRSCTGCGICVQSCPAFPRAILIK
ncbi:MAG: 4Fe-4S dicluster domain-containing protein [Leptospiraceae bacterium]|nr:4Fe-4S dicluster domain-containing protein [Leptospiraceae bacterium]MCP5502164.1 4Fe-4S dicluster domain-containing protein [Leptospiraceae bacterium]